MKRMLYPTYLDNFKCIGKDCEDNCCKHWNIFVDKSSYTKYQKLSNSELKNKIISGIEKSNSNNSKEAYSKMKLNQDGSCIMLDSEGLCAIQKELSHGYLCKTCRVYPRKLININGVVETSLSLSCPEAARVILKNKQPMEFEFTQNTEVEKVSNIVTTEHLNIPHIQAYWEIREFTVQVLQCRDYTISERLFILATTCSQLELAKTKNDVLDILDKAIGDIQSGLFKDILEKFPKTSDTQYKLLYKWIELQNGSNHNLRYGDFLDNIKSVLAASNESLIERIEKYDKLTDEIFIPALNQYEYIFEQYWVNTIFAEAFPLSPKTIMENFIDLLIRYSIMKMHIVGIGICHGELNENLIIEAIQLYSKAFEHNKNLLDAIIKDFKEQNYISLAYAIVLIN